MYTYTIHNRSNASRSKYEATMTTIKIVATYLIRAVVNMGAHMGLYGAGEEFPIPRDIEEVIEGFSRLKLTHRNNEPRTNDETVTKEAAVATVLLV